MNKKEYDFNMHVLEFHTDVIDDRINTDVYAPLRVLREKECRRPKTKVQRVFDFMYPGAKVWTAEEIVRSETGKYYFYEENGEYEDESLCDPEHGGAWYELPDDFKCPEDVFFILKHCIDLIPNSAIGSRTAAEMHLEWCKNPVGVDKGDKLKDFLDDCSYLYCSKFDDVEEWKERKIEMLKDQFKELCAIFLDQPLTVAEAFLFEDLVKSEVGKKVIDLLFNDPEGLEKAFIRVREYKKD